MTKSGVSHMNKFSFKPYRENTSFNENDDEDDNDNV